jgi:hypothetical protein
VINNVKLRKYKDHPSVFVPDIGEVVRARRSPGDPFLSAIVVRVRRLRDGHIRVTVEWQESYEDAGATKPSPVVAGELGRITFPPERMALLIRQDSRAAHTID